MVHVNHRSKMDLKYSLASPKDDKALGIIF